LPGSAELAAQSAIPGSAAARRHNQLHCGSTTVKISLYRYVAIIEM